MASGRLVVISISKIVWPSCCWTDSTATPASVRSSASWRSSTLRSTNSRSQWGETLIFSLSRYSSGEYLARLKVSNQQSAVSTQPLNIFAGPGLKHSVPNLLLQVVLLTFALLLTRQAPIRGICSKLSNLKNLSFLVTVSGLNAEC